MDFWPGQFASPQANAKKGRKRKAPPKYERVVANYPVLDYGSLASAVELKRPNGYEWVFPTESNKGRLRAVTEPRKFFPSTRPHNIEIPRATLKQRAEQGANFLRTYQPDVDIPFDLIKNELRESDILTDAVQTFDPFCGNTLTSVYCNEAYRKRNILVAFPTGPGGSDLNISPIYFRTDNLQFAPRHSPAWSFETPIQHITSTSPGSRPGSTRKTDNFLAVRTYGGTSIFDLQGQVTHGLAQAPPRPTELSVILPTDVGGGSLMDLSFTSSVPEMFLIDSRGNLYKYTLRNERKFSNHLLAGDSEKSDDTFWRVRARDSSFEGVFCSSKSIRLFDTRSGIATSELYSVAAESSHVVTSVEATGVEHLLCASTTTEVLWLDDRFPKRPLLGSKHHRNFDRTLSVQSVVADQAIISLLSSRHNGYVSAFGVTTPEEGPLQCCINSSALPFTGSSGTNTFSRTIVRHLNEDSFSLLELNEQGSIHHMELVYETDGAESFESRRSQLTLHWSDEVKKLDKQSEGLRPDYGRLGGRELVEVDLSGLYEKLVNADEEANRQDAEGNAESLYDLLDRIPSFWRNSEMEPTTSTTLFDVVFNSNEDPIPQARADFLTGTPLNSTRGYRALRQGRLSLSSDKMKKLRGEAGWHFDLASTLRNLDSAVFREDENSSDSDALTPYTVSRRNEIPEADQRESESGQQLALDLALSTDVMRSASFKSTHPNKSDESLEIADTLSIATGKLSLNNRTDEPPHVAFGSCRPSERDTKAYYKETHVYGDEDNEMEDIEKPVEMPLGVRLLLNEWVVGSDPKDYAYVDPYGLKERHEEGPQDNFIVMTQASMAQTQSQAPPTIIATKKLASTQPKQPPAILPASQPLAKAQVLPRQLQTQASYSQVFGTQPDSQGQDSQYAMASTQILPGPFGGRPAAGPKKKPPKKRIGGF
ncbi:hypothetical protein SCHPADRAFT_941714 [Schizopora paradoxa]|uniref:RRN6 K-rich C-terminal domain-containing protein n=1 Tax=Schizopora paradoxa TaxID=27342 RepID=A0A0H2RJ40_9AGAM|nr:hypothetical protein SCHPADRAFT_941714 [Schizopora paradoxa]